MSLNNESGSSMSFEELVNLNGEAMAVLDEVPYQPVVYAVPKEWLESWMTLLENSGIINNLLRFFGLGPVQMINTPGAPRPSALARGAALVSQAASLAPELVEDALGPDVDGGVLGRRRCRAVATAGGPGQPGGHEVVDGGGGGRVERAELGDGNAVDRDDDALARPGAPHDGGDVVAQLADADPFHRRAP